jgi:Zn-dependent protease with chaperone function
MTDEDFDALVMRLETYERKHPAAYKLRLILLAGLGYLYLLVVSLVLLAIIVFVAIAGRFNFLLIKVLWIPLGLVGVVLRAFWVHLPLPEGQEIKGDEAPRLFDLINEVRRVVDGPRVSHVLISDYFNAGIQQVSRFGLFGLGKTYLVIGLPLMHALTPAEFRAIMAHEFGHLSSKHGQFTGWVYRVRHTWIQIMTTMDQEKRHGSKIFRWFLDWYAPFFNAYSFVLARRQEYEADEYAVEVAGKQHAAQALISLELKERRLAEEFWPNFYRQADGEWEPPREPLTQMLAHLKDPIAADTIAKWFTDSLFSQTGSADSHPSLPDRLAAMGYARDIKTNHGLLQELANPATGDAADFYLASIPQPYLTNRNRWWREAITNTWRERYKFILASHKSLQELQEKIKTTPLTDDERWQEARLTLETEGAAVARPLLEEVVANQPDNAGARYVLGQILLEQQDEAGVGLIERAVVNDPGAEISGCHLIYSFLRSQGKHEQAQEYLVRAQKLYDNLQRGQYERATIYPGDEFSCHDLEPAVSEALRAQLKQFSKIRKAYLVKKIVHYFPDQPLHVLGLVPRRPWYRGRSEPDEAALIQSLAANLQFAGELLIVMLEGNRRNLRSKLRTVPDASII